MPKNYNVRLNVLDRNKEQIVNIHQNNKIIKPNESKRMAECPAEDLPNRKRSVFGDVTNNVICDKQQIKQKSKDKMLIFDESKLKFEEPPTKEIRKSKRLSEKQVKSSESSEISYLSAKDCFSPTADDSNYQTPTSFTSNLENSIKTDSKEPILPEGVQNFDKEMESDIFAVSIYAQDIFRHFKEREKKFQLKHYLVFHPEINKSMRAILVDWMAEVQESFELNHETLYLGVKLIDFFLSRSESMPRANLQLLASTALLIAAKFDERCPPAIEDFVYICDDAYDCNQIIKTEISILKSIDFDLGIPISYTFLRRYARCAKQTMEVLTLSRYILEISLMDYNLIEELDSRLAAAALSLAMQMSKLEHWNKTLEYYSEFKYDDLKDLIPKLNALLKKAGKNGLKTMYTKYCHKIFFEVAKIPPLEDSAITL